jgi:arylsulfatase A-like enzyme
MFVRLLSAVLLFCSFAAPCAHAAPPNIVFILADDLGYTDLSCQGSAYYETPNIDRLAAGGMRFARYYTSPNCAPSRAALMTGQYAPRGVYTVGSAERGEAADRALTVPKNVQELPLDRRTVGDVLQQAGYATALFGKWHLGNEGDHHPAKRGFGEAFVLAGGKYFDFEMMPPVESPKGAYLTDYLTDRAVDFIDRSKSAPFFLYLPHFAVHKPIEPKPAYAAAWKEKAPQGTHWNADFAAMIQSLDESVGRVLDALDRAGVADNTLVIFTSDNGGVGGYGRTEPPSDKRGITDNAPLRGGKGTLYEGGVRVPFIARWPGVVAPGSTCDAPIAHIDLLPTLAAAAGSALPEQPLDGIDIGPLLRQQAAPARGPLYLHFPVYLESYVHDKGWRTTPASYLIDGDWKLLEFAEGKRAELYHLGEDPGEHHDLAAKQPEKVEAMRQQLDAWRTETGAALAR